MARSCERLFDEDGAIAEGGYCFALASRKRVGDLARLRDGAHPTAAAASRRFQQHRITDRFGDSRRFGGVQRLTLICAYPVLARKSNPHQPTYSARLGSMRPR